MCAYAIKTIRNGGTVDLQVIGTSSLPRHRCLVGPSVASEIVQDLAEPVPNDVLFNELNRKPTTKMDSLLFAIDKAVREYAPRGGEKGLSILLELIQRRLYGAETGAFPPGS